MERLGRAIPFIVYRQKQGFNLTPQGGAFLESLETKLAVIAVAGKYRTGKSYLLNRVILDLDSPQGGFQVGPTINPCTKGLWIYDQPIPHRTQDGEEVSVLVVDSEGIGAFDQDQNHDTKIFMMALLVSSFFIYNSIGSIDENALNNMNLIVNLTKNLQVRSSDSSLDVDEISEYFPSFLWVIRDFALRLQDQAGNPITSKEYLQNSLQLQKGLSESIEAKNRVRKLIKHFFRDRDCFVVVRPTEDQRLLQNLMRAPDDQLRPEFVNQINTLRTLIYRKAKPKMLNSKALNGLMLKNMIEAYIGAINSGSVPTIQGAWTNVCQAQCEKTIDLSTQEYQEMLRVDIPKTAMNPKKLKAAHKALREKALKNFRANAIGDKVAQHQEALLKKIDQRFNVINQQNERKIAKESQQVCQNLQREMLDKLKQGDFSDFNSFRRQFQQKVKQFRQNAPESVQTQMKLKELSASLLSEAADYISRNAVQQHQNESRRMNQQLDLLKTTLDAKKEQFSNQRDFLKNRIKELETENYQLKGTISSLEMRLEELKQERARIEQKYDKHIDNFRDVQQSNEFKEKYNQLMVQYNSEVKELNRQINQLQKELAIARKELEWRDRDTSSTSTQLRTVEDQLRDVKAQLKVAKQQLQQKDRELRSKPASDGMVPQSQHQLEKTYLQNQIQSLTNQVNQGKSMQQKLILALHMKPPEKPQEDNRQSNKHLSMTIERLEEKNQMQEQKIEQLKRFQKMIQHASAIQCKMCGKTLNSSVFSAHISVCLTDMSRINSESGYYQIVVSQSMIRETPDMKPYTEYVMTVTYKNKTWNVTRRYKMFTSLHSSLQRTFPDVQLPDVDIFSSSSQSQFNQVRPTVLEDRRKACQYYLMELASIPVIKNSDILRKFLSVDQHFGEDAAPRRKIGLSAAQSNQEVSK